MLRMNMAGANICVGEDDDDDKDDDEDGDATEEASSCHAATFSCMGFFSEHFFARDKYKYINIYLFTMFS